MKAIKFIGRHKLALFLVLLASGLVFLTFALPTRTTRTTITSPSGSRLWGSTEVMVAKYYSDIVRDLLIVEGNPGIIAKWGYGIGRNMIDCRSQKLNQNGIRQWRPFNEGIVLFSPSAYPHVISDGMGGAFIVWNWAPLFNEIRAQHVDGNGNLLWGPNGITVCDARSQGVRSVIGHNIIGDGKGGLIIAWELYDGISVYSSGVLAQRMDYNGNFLWGLNGVSVFGTGFSLCGIVSDGASGAIVLLDNYNYQNRICNDLRAQRVDKSGVSQWPSGIPICQVSGVDIEIGSDDVGFFIPVIPTTGGRFIVAWSDNRNSLGASARNDIFAQSFDINGNILWQVNGVPVNTATDKQRNPQLVYDNDGGAVVVWEDNRNGVDNWDIYAQRIHGRGTLYWPANVNPQQRQTEGIPVAIGQKVQKDFSVVGTGSIANVVWKEYVASNAVDLYVQSLDGMGCLRWQSTGIKVSDKQNEKGQVKMIKDTDGDVIIVWTDSRPSLQRFYMSSIYAQKIKVR